MTGLHGWDLKRKRKFRLLVLDMISRRHAEQGERMDDLELFHMLKSWGAEAEINDVVTILQELGDRGYVRFRQYRNKFSGRTSLTDIEICAKGQDIVDGSTTDPAF